MVQLTGDLADRYGRPSPARRPALVLGVGVLVLAAVAWLVWVTTFHSSPQVTSELVGYDVRGPHAVVASYQVVRRDTGVGATCLLRALAADHAVVGERSVRVARGPANARVTSTVRTEREATSVDLVGCTAAGQTRQR